MTKAETSSHLCTWLAHSLQYGKMQFNVYNALPSTVGGELIVFLFR